VGDADAALLGGLKELFPAEPPGVTNIDRGQFLSLLESLAGHPRVVFGKREAATVSGRPVRPPLAMRRRRLVVDWPADHTPLVADGKAWVLVGTSFLPVALGLPSRWAALLDSGLVLDPASAVTALARLQDWFEIPPELLERLPEPSTPAVEVELEGSLNHLGATMHFRYGTHRRPAGPSAPEVLDLGDHEGVTSPDLERMAEDSLRQWGFDGPDARGRFVMRDGQAILRFHAFGLGQLDPEWQITTGERFAAFAKDIVPIKPVFEFRGSGEDWFTMELGYEAGPGRDIPAAQIRQLLERGRHDRKLKNGKIAVLDPGMAEEMQATIADCHPQQDQPGLFRIDRRQAAYLRQTARDIGADMSGSEPWADATDQEDELFVGISAQLRPYQEGGVRWMRGLAEHGMGGILADDMGLGKTLQTLVFLHHATGPALVVCPSSLVDNWLAEAGRFVPGLKAMALTGPERRELLQHEEADLFVTSYAILRLDAEAFRQRPFEVVILDEAQQIKNPDAQITRAAWGLDARHRFALTGTPIENRLSDLWSIMNFVLPGYLGPRKEFADRFEKPLRDGPAPELQRRLARRLKPVVMRRLKRDVLQDLANCPPRSAKSTMASCGKAASHSTMRKAGESAWWPSPPSCGFARHAATCASSISPISIPKRRR
jgi:hypothetical protein